MSELREYILVNGDIEWVGYGKAGIKLAKIKYLHKTSTDMHSDDMYTCNQRWSTLGPVGFPQKIYDFLTNLPSGEPILIGFRIPQ